MKYFSYKNSTFKTISVSIISLGMISVIFWDISRRVNPNRIDVVLAVIGISLFGIGFIKSLYDLFSNNRHISVIRKNTYLLRLFKNGNKGLFIILSGIYYSLTLLCCMVIALALGNNLSSLQAYWGYYLICFFVLMLIGGLSEYKRYKGLEKNELI